MLSSQPDGYLALPASGKGAPVLVLHAWWGLNATIQALCDRLAAAGFVAFAPDLYHGQTADTIPEAEALRDELDADSAPAFAAVHGAAAYLSAHPASAGAAGAVAHLAVIGFSLGAYFALDLSVSDPERVRSVVVFYGTRSGDDYAQARAAYLGHFAEQDDFEPQSEVESLANTLRQAGRPVSFHIYPGAGHWFFEPDRPDAYHPAAAQLAWERTLAFLNQATHS